MLAERLTAQLLAGPPARDPVAVTERLLAIQAQDPRGARLAVRARSRGLSAADVDRALTGERSLVISWLNRGTLHLVRSEDYPWLHALTTPHVAAGNARRLAQEGVPPAAADRGVAAIEAALAEEGPLTRDELAARVAAAGARTQGQALVRDWLGEPQPVDRDRALAELARRYLAGHGPADAHDLARWAGLPLRDARAGLAAIARELRERGDGLVELARRPAEVELPPLRLLGAFDPVLHGWRSREPVLAGNEGRVVSGGLFRPFALVDGRAAATWRLAGGEVELEPFGRVPREALAADAADVVRFLGLRR